MTRLFYGSVIAGMALVILAAAVLPLPENQRYRSEIGVIPDGGREENFTIQWPQDRVQPLRAPTAGAVTVAGGAAVLPGPGDIASAEVFRLRDMAGNVIGLASRSTSMRPGANGTAASQGSDWILMIPSRGSLFLTQTNSRDVAPRPPATGAGLAPAQDSAAFWSQGTRLRVTAGPASGGSGEVVGGTEEFTDLRGTYDETWDLEEVAADGTTRGRITLGTQIQAVME